MSLASEANWTPPELRPGFNPYPAYVAGGFFFFTAVNVLVQNWLCWPLPADRSRKQRWKWCNICVSFCHSTLTGFCAPLVFYLSPTAREDMINGYSDFAHALVGKISSHSGKRLRRSKASPLAISSTTSWICSSTT